MDNCVKVLDHGLVRLVDSMGSDLSIVRNARVSYDAAWRAGENEKGDAGLIRYLYKNSHNTPFESVILTFEIKAPIFVFRQWHRHRTQSYNELSARYRELPEEFYIPEPHLIGEQSEDNKQCRTIADAAHEATGEYEVEQEQRMRRLCSIMEDQNGSAFITYRQLLKDGVPRELARSVLPMGTYSHMFTTVNLHNLFKFMGERLHTHAQYEIRVYAQAMLDMVKEIAPVATQAFIDGLGEGYDC